MNYTMTNPCDKCPFRNDIRPFLQAGRVRQIEASLERGTFPCHQTIDYSNDSEDGEPLVPANAQHCAGALILLEKLERPSQMMRICERLGLYDRRKLNMDAPVYDSFKDMAKRQPR